jgi:glycosyltransferase involved in cell wall biosynthesis
MQGLKVDVLTSRAGQVRTDGSGGPDSVRFLRSWEVAHTPIIPALPGELLRLPRLSVVHLHIGQAFVPESVYLVHLLRGLPYVAHVHCDIGPSGAAGFLLGAYKPLILGRVLRAAAAVVVFTDEQRSVISSEYRLDPGRVSVIPNGVDKSFFYAGERVLHEKPRLLFVGRFVAQKNLALFLRALDGVSERFETSLVGEGELGAELKKAVEDLRLCNVRFHGRVEGADLRELYRTADVLVLPSEREAFGLAVLEAMAMGLPIVATDVSGTRALVAPDQNGVLVPPGDPAALREALLSVTGDPDRYRQMSERSRHLAAGYSWEAAGAAFERLYAQASRL